MTHLDDHMETLDIARLNNIATNGRWFIAGLALLNYVGGSSALAIAALITLVLAMGADILQSKIASIIVYAYAAWVVIFSVIFNVW